jgi:hypothetical protein
MVHPRGYGLDVRQPHDQEHRPDDVRPEGGYEHEEVDHCRIDAVYSARLCRTDPGIRQRWHDTGQSKPQTTSFQQGGGNATPAAPGELSKPGQPPRPGLRARHVPAMQPRGRLERRDVRASLLNRVWALGAGQGQAMTGVPQDATETRRGGTAARRRGPRPKAGPWCSPSPIKSALSSYWRLRPHRTTSGFAPAPTR